MKTNEYQKKYYEKRKKENPDFMEKKRKYMKKYNKEYWKNPINKEKKKIIDKKYRNKPEVKKRRNEWQKEYWKNNPEKRKKLSREYNQKKQKIFNFFKSLKKYICSCGNIFYGIPGLNISCNKCKNNFKESECEN